ncbi:MAG: glycosyltransferase family 2 protein [Deltaproteobacteria bacterium]|nr:glycosyltransferase family 2 protein [Deltaproteobacteria bacterium]
MAVVLWGSVLLLLHTYLFYPLSLLLWDAGRQAVELRRYLVKGRDRRRRRGAAFTPSVSLIIPAHDEAECIGAKLDNSLSLDYPDDKLEIVVGSDGSSDGTDEIVSACPDGRVRLSTAPRGGKVAVLNRCVPAACGEIVVLTDANTMIDRRALGALVRHFVDPDVGAVCGRLKLYNRRRKEYEESVYWSYETLLKHYEGQHGAVLGANGGLYAMRRTLFERLPPDTVVDDFVIPQRLLERGYQVDWEPEAVAYEETTEDYSREFARRARISAGNFQALVRHGGLLSPWRRPFVSYAFWSHKALRWFAPFLLALALVSNALLAPWSPFYALLFAVQLAFYGLALAGTSKLLTGPLKRVASTARYFVSMNLALAVGFWRFVRGSQGAAWERTARS